MKKVNIAILGLGTVGGGTYEILTTNKEKIQRADDLDINVKYVLDKSSERMDYYKIPDSSRAKSLDEIVADKDVSLVVEVIGGVEPAKTFILACLNAGKTVVTANKELIAKHWSELEAAAKKNNAGFYFEASCGGGIPVIRALKESLQGDKIEQIMGIINGTTNYILTKMTNEGLPYDSVLKTAQELGFAEFDPTSDVDGYDTMYKLSILSSLAFHTCIPYGVVHREGITKVTAYDIKHASETGYVIKLLAIGKRNGNDVEVRVHPALIQKTHPLASVNDSFNAVFLKGDFVDDVMLYGRGAGARPTGSAIVSDVIYASKKTQHDYSDFENNGKVSSDIKICTNFSSGFYMALSVVDEPGVLASITDILGKCGVSIRSMNQSDASGGQAEIVLMTHDTLLNSVTKAIDSISKLPKVVSVNNLIPVIE